MARRRRHRNSDLGGGLRPELGGTGAGAAKAGSQAIGVPVITEELTETDIGVHFAKGGGVCGELEAPKEAEAEAAEIGG